MSEVLWSDIWYTLILLLIKFIVVQGCTADHYMLQVFAHVVNRFVKKAQEYVISKCQVNSSNKTTKFGHLHIND